MSILIVPKEKEIIVVQNKVYIKIMVVQNKLYYSNSCDGLIDPIFIIEKITEILSLSGYLELFD